MDASTEDFKWFGEGFDGFPRGLPNDCIEYALYVIDAKLQQIDIRQKLRTVQKSANLLTKKLLNGYIWQRDSFKLDLAQEDGTSWGCMRRSRARINAVTPGLQLLRGRTNYGDSIEDEWLIVYILHRLSEEYPDVWIRAVDTDGQFLLIEAANHLPTWLNPEVAKFRVCRAGSVGKDRLHLLQVWIHRGELRIIPPDKSAEGGVKEHPPATAETLQEALSFLSHGRSKLLHLPSVQKEAFYRLDKYPQKIKDNLHHALVTIPRKLAYILHEDETYISSAVEAFYLRDPIALQPLKTTDNASLIFPPQNLVTVSVKFTKIGYAQIKSQQFPAPMMWKQAFLDRDDDNSYTKVETGMKLACGFEMLMSDPQNKDKRQVREIALLLEDVNTGEDYLPSIGEIAQWRQTQDDERWLDINFEDFERELSGNKANSKWDGCSGFGDKAAQDNLRRMVAKFENFFEDDNAGLEGAEEQENTDDDDDDIEDDTSRQQSTLNSDDPDIHFNEDGFTSMMEEMMGMSTTGLRQTSNALIPSQILKADASVGIHREDPEIRNAMRAIEHELRDAGALRLDPPLATEKSTSQMKFSCISTDDHEGRPVRSTPVDESSEEVDLNLNLARNLLASFKSQGGMAGPGSNMMGLMGVQLPRDDGEGPGQT